MLSLFRKNLLINYLLLLPYALFLHLGVWLRRIPVQENPSNWVFNQFMGKLQMSYELQTILATILIAIIAILLSNLSVKYRLLPNGQLFGGIFFILFCGLHASSLSLTASLLACFFFVIDLEQIMSIYNQKTSPLRLFNFGFFVGMATLFYVPYYVYLFLGIIGITILKGFSLKEFFQIIVGFLTVFFLFCTAAFVGDFLDIFYSQQIQSYFSPYLFSMSYGKNGLIVMGILSLVFLASFISLNLFQVKKTILIQKYFDLIFWTVFVSFLSLLFLRITEINHIHLFILPLSILMGLMISKIKNQLMAETIHLTLIIFALFLQFQNW